MLKITEITGFRIEFTLPLEGLRDKIFTTEGFNYGGGSLYQKFKNKVPESLHSAIKSLNDSNVFVMDAMDGNFSFAYHGRNHDKSEEVAKILVSMCKHVHNIDTEVQVKISKRMTVEEEVVVIF